MRKVIDVETGTDNALSGLKNEQMVLNEFNNWKENKNAKKWLSILGIDLNKIIDIKAEVITGCKADISVKIYLLNTLEPVTKNIQIKLVRDRKGFSQVDKRWLKDYHKIWKFSDEVYEILKCFCGEKSPYIKDTKFENRMLMTEFTLNEQTLVIDWIEENKVKIINDIIRGRGDYIAEWILVIHNHKSKFKWALKSIDDVINFYLSKKIEITQSGSIKIGDVLLQRKGGDSGRRTANKLQFKIDPTKIFRI